MQADTPDLVNSKDSTHKISATPSSTPVALNANQWGYSLSKSATTFSAVPAGAQATPAVVADVTKAKPSGCTNPANCTKQVTFASNIDPAKLASGSYSTTITYTATAKTPPHAQVVEPTICHSGDLLNNDCQVDLDPNMIPVKYNDKKAAWESVATPENAAHQGEWYDYNNKQWANAITVNPKKLDKYRGHNEVVDQADILGFWVYIPRYSYEVQRRDGTDKPVPAQNFLISFEKVDPSIPKRSPAACPEKNKNYRTECDLNRDYSKRQASDNGTWATHPAFTLDIKKLNGGYIHKELNGIWFAKFETTGTTDRPTVLPNEAHISGHYSGMDKKVGNFYSLAKTLGVEDHNNVGGSGFTTKYNHNLTKFSSHMVNNNDWGAATYLSASKYGAGFDKVQMNSSAAEHTNYGYTYGTTGCGPQSDGNTNRYDNSGTLGTSQACGDADHAYNGRLGQLASTTNNIYGIYDMSGGGWEYTAASYGSDLSNSSTSYFSSAAHPPYVNTYNITNMNSCTFATCGGQALYETNDGVGTDTGNHMWNGQYMSFRPASYPWFGRGGSSSDGSDAGLFYASSRGGYANYDYFAFRVALAPTAQN